MTCGFGQDPQRCMINADLVGLGRELSLALREVRN
jgi:hypothetical protein